MEELVIRPTTKFIKAGYAVVFLLIIAGAVAQYKVEELRRLPQGAVPGVLALLLLWPLSRHIGRRFMKMTIIGDKLRYEVGMLSKSTRTIQLSKVQDVTVKQHLGQRMAGVGSLSIETAGESSRLTFPSIDSPQSMAEHIIDASHRIGVRGIVDEREETQRQGGSDNRGEQGPGKGHGTGAGGIGS
jgi:membrane protein YdbS with pleckstrin-like domain